MVNDHVLGVLKSLLQHSVGNKVYSHSCFTLNDLHIHFILFFLSTEETKELVSWMRGHDSSVSSISVHGSGRYAITTSTDTAQLWDLDTFQRRRKLNVRQSVGIQKVSKG